MIYWCTIGKTLDKNCLKLFSFNITTFIIKLVTYKNLKKYYIFISNNFQITYGEKRGQKSGSMYKGHADILAPQVK